MCHAMLASWGCNDPYTQNGAVLAISDTIKSTACGYILGDVNHKTVAWDDPLVYDCFVPAEIELLRYVEEKPSYDSTIYITTIPHPDNVKIIANRGIKRIIYLPVRPHYVPKNYLKRYAKFVTLFHSLKIEKYTYNLSWLKDKLSIVEEQVPELFE